MERSRGITVYGTAVIMFGAYNLLGAGNYRQFSLMFRPLTPLLITALYIFTILYGICGVYCGTRVLKLENWARKTVVGLTAFSVISGFLLNRTVMANFKEFLLSERVSIAPDMVGQVYTYAVIITAVVTIFELSVIYYFTRPEVVKQFH